MITSRGAGGRRSKWTSGPKYMRGSQGEGGCILLTPSFPHFDSLCCIADSGVSAYSHPCFIGSSNNAYMHAKSLQSCLTLCNPIDCSLPVCPWDSPGKNTGVGCFALLQGIFLIQGSKPLLLFPALAGGFFTTSVSCPHFIGSSNNRGRKFQNRLGQEPKEEKRVRVYY